MDTKAGRKDAEIPANPGGQGGDYRFLDFTLDPRRQLLIHGADEIRLRPRTYDVLVHLVTHAGRVVGKSELMESVWKDVAVTDDSLVQSLMEIRRALGQAEGIVKTVRGRGYLFDTGVEMVTKDAVPTQGQDPHRDQTTDSSTRDEPSTDRPGLSSALVVVAVIAGIAAIVWWIGLSARRQASARAPTGTIRSIAVLPLQNQSRDQEQEYFADGITDELITQLGKIGSLRVISRTSVMRLKGTRKALAEIAQDLNVDAVVEGSVARSAERVRVTAQVIQVNPEKLLWAERYDRALGDIVMLQGELAREITNAIRIALNADEQARLGDVRPVNRDAYEALLKGRYYRNKRTEATTKKAMEYFREAIEKDPSYALAFASLSDSYISFALSEALQEVLPAREAFPQARAAVNRALAIDDTLAEAHATLGHIKFQYDRDWTDAEKEFKRAIELNPNYAGAHHWYALCLVWMGRQDEALEEIRRARELDPLSLILNASVAWILAIGGQYEQAIDQSRKTIEIDPSFPLGHYRLGQTYVLSGRYVEAVAALEKARALSGNPRVTAELGLAHALAGNRGEALKLVGQLNEQSKQRYISPFNRAVIYGGLGDKRGAMEWLEKAYDERSVSLNLLKLSPAFISLRGDARFDAMVRGLGMEAFRSAQRPQ
jgi:TolB-like protein/DNA-binding winged helix-turn-helix (wHTH) protein/Tfp pilus assembly protein PilF